VCTAARVPLSLRLLLLLPWRMWAHRALTGLLTPALRVRADTHADVRLHARPLYSLTLPRTDLRIAGDENGAIGGAGVGGARPIGSMSGGGGSGLGGETPFLGRGTPRLGGMTPALGSRTPAGARDVAAAVAGCGGGWGGWGGWGCGGGGGTFGLGRLVVLRHGGWGVRVVISVSTTASHVRLTCGGRISRRRHASAVQRRLRDANGRRWRRDARARGVRVGHARGPGRRRGRGRRVRPDGVSRGGALWARRAVQFDHRTHPPLEFFCRFGAAAAGSIGGGYDDYGGGGYDDTAMAPPPVPAAGDEGHVAAAAAAWGVRGVWVSVVGGELEGKAGVVQAAGAGGSVATVRLDGGAVRVPRAACPSSPHTRRRRRAGHVYPDAIPRADAARRGRHGALLQRPEDGADGCARMRARGARCARSTRHSCHKNDSAFALVFVCVPARCVALRLTPRPRVMCLRAAFIVHISNADAICRGPQNDVFVHPMRELARFNSDF
jgi:hypothetical protein